MSFSIAPFGQTKAGQPVSICRLTGPDCTISVLTWGAALQSVIVPSAKGPLDVLLGCDTMEDYEAQECYLGSLVGRVANRIAGGSFTLNKQYYPLYRNSGINTLHGGKIGWSHRVFTLLEQTESSFVLGLESPDGEEGFPGKIDLRVRYCLVPGGFALEWEGVSDKPAPFAPSTHAYWNLAGHNSGDILKHQLQLFANQYTPVNEFLIPTGKIKSATGNPFDFTAAKEIGHDINSGYPQLVITNGYDHNFIVNGEQDTLRPVARVFCEDSRICMEQWSTLPGVQFYTGNFLLVRKAKGGTAYGKNEGFCLEPQYYPNFINCPSFPQGILQPGIPRCDRTEWRFACK